jgi:hypothetical protein
MPTAMTLLRFSPIVFEFVGTVLVFLDALRINARNLPHRFAIGDQPGYTKWYYHQAALGFLLLLLGITLQGLYLAL